MTMKISVEAPGIRAAEQERAPFTDFIVKVHSRCDLACDYCYMYPPGDTSWRERPRLISARVIAALAGRVAEHVRGRARSINLLLHGGEPLLAGPDVLRSVVESVRTAVHEADPDIEVVAGVQSNGSRLTEAHVELFARLGVSVGLSLDGTAASHDRHRRDHRGQGSHEGVLRALELLRGAGVPGLFAGLLCVIDVESDPVATLDALFAHQPPTVDLLLPHASWATPPSAGYGGWLAAAFDHWYALRPPGPEIRMFQELLVALLGGPSASESASLAPSGSVVIETDGTIEQVDALKLIYPGAAATGLDVFRHGFDEALAHPGIAARRAGWSALAAECRACTFGSVCAGGFYGHRYRPGNGFANPTVYCADMFELIGHMRERIRGDLAVPVGAGPWRV